MEQKIYPDNYGRDTWKTRPTGRLYVHIVNSQLYAEITGTEPPASPISAKTYTQHGYPWFELYDEAKADVAVSDTLAGVKSVKEMDAEKGVLNVKLSSTELDKRRKSWKPRKPGFTSGYLWKYAEQVGAARGGAVTHPGGAETRSYADI